MSRSSAGSPQSGAIRHQHRLRAEPCGHRRAQGDSCPQEGRGWGHGCPHGLSPGQGGCRKGRRTWGRTGLSWGTHSRGNHGWAPTGGAAAGCPPGSVPPQGSQTPSPRTKRGHEVRPRSTVAAPGPFPPAHTRGALRLAVPLKIPPPSALLNSLAAGKRQQGRNEAPNVITVLVSLPPASSQPHLSQRQRAGREERNQCLSLA